MPLVVVKLTAMGVASPSIRRHPNESMLTGGLAAGLPQQLHVWLLI